MAVEVLKLCMENGFLLDKEMLNLFLEFREEEATKIIEAIGTLNIEERVISLKLFEKIFEKLKKTIFAEEGFRDVHDFFKKLEQPKQIGVLKESEKNISNEENPVKLLFAPAFNQRKITVRDFVSHFRSRFEIMSSFFDAKNLENLTSIRKIGMDKSTHSIIAMVLGKRVTKNKNILFHVEDLTGNSLVLVNQNKEELFEKAEEVLVDDVLAFEVNGTKEILFANNIHFPSASLPEKKYGHTDQYIAFMGDMHVGSKMFLEKNVLNFVKWLNGKQGDERQKEIALKVKYLFITGDNVDGVSQYPGQESLLDEKTSIGQYKKMEEILKLIRKDIQIIICPGQHDSVWVGEPQPIIGERWAPGLYKMDNVHLVPNPARVEISGGFKVLMYHGASINYFIEEIPKIRIKYGHNSPTKVVKELLKRRHLSPIHGLSDYIPCEKDYMVLEEIPDIISTGDQHRCEVSMYNNILLIAGSCWQSITPFEEKVGNNPDPCKVPLFNLKTREIKILDFSDEKIDEEEKIIENQLDEEEKIIENQLVGEN